MNLKSGAPALRGEAPGVRGPQRPAFAYPADLAEHVHAAWNGNPEGLDAPPLAFLHHLAGLIYHASFLTDESRPVHMSLCCTPGRRALAGARAIPLDVIEFQRARDLTVSEMRKLSSAFEPLRSAMWVCYGSRTPRGQICGILDIDPSWHYAHLGLSYGFSGMPDALMAGSFGPGHVVMSRGNDVLGSLQAGGLSGVRPSTTQDLAGLRRLFEEGVGLLAQGVQQSGRDDFAWRAYTNVVLGVVNLMEEAGHGGALVYAAQADRDALGAQVRMKYAVKGSRSRLLQERFLEFMAARGRLLSLEAKSDGPGVHCLDVNQALQHREAQAACELAERKLSQACEFVARLAGVDGAIVLATDLTLLGFGAEIRTAPDPRVKFFRACDGTSAAHEDLDVEEFGMRHRSAAFLCSRLSQSGVFVTSQDRGVTLVWKRSPGRCHVLQHVRTKGANVVGS